MSLLPIAQAWSLLSPEASPHLDRARMKQQARTFFEAELEAVFVGGDDSALVDVRMKGGAATTRVRVLTAAIDDAPDVRAAADAGVIAIGGAGFDALVARTKRVFQVVAAPIEGPDARAPLLVAAVIASLLLAPIVPPGGGTIFGVKGARERLNSLVAQGVA